LALPEIGSGDRFLSFLPLFHTFGRWLEMLGCLFWGATYTFLENPAVDTIVDGMRRVRPTVFISIPKKWQQLYEVITTRVDPEIDADDDIKGAVEEVTGGALRWGLSAAGYLPPQVFRFFQRYGTELMSGFGMTEATGGITMTPPGEYRDDSLGRALPGIEIRLADDGELLLRGPYVMQGYYKSDESAFVDGWLPSGDIMTMSDDGFIEIVDRKKEIYKNSRGETIAPQRIENLFADFEAARQVFLVGDHRPYNTLLIHPDLEADGGILNDMDEAHRRAYFASLVVSVNGFLMPYERIVDFRLIERPFSAERGELTPKGTYKRRAIEESFGDVISTMYERNTTSIDWQGTEVRIPNWFFRENGCVIGDIVATPDGLSIPKLNRRLKLARVPDDDRLLRIGDFLYRLDGGRLDLQRLVTDPLNWLGNYDLFHFVGDAIIAWYRAGRDETSFGLHGRAEPRIISEELQQQFSAIVHAGERSLYGLHLAVLFLQADDEALGLLAANYLRGVIDDEGGAYRSIALEIAFRPALASDNAVRRELLLAGLPLVDAQQLCRLLDVYLDCDTSIFNSDVIRRIVTIAHTSDHLAAIEDTLAARRVDLGKTSERVVLIAVLFDLLVDFAIRHPRRIQRVRRTVVQCQLQTDSEALAHIAGEAGKQLLEGRRTWFGENKRVAIDVETGEDYTWPDVISFEEGLDPDDQARLLRALEETCVLRESIFLFSGGRVVGLHDLPRGGIWVTHLGSRHGKSVYRVKVQTRHHGSFDMAINLNQELSPDEVRNEVNWLIAAGGTRGRASLVEEFGGFWEEMQLWSKEYVPGETVARFLGRKARKRKNNQQTKRRLYNLWPYFVWCASEAFVGLLTRTGYCVELADPSSHGIIVPPHDYQAGTRIISISDRVPFESLRAFFTRFYASFVQATEDAHPALIQGPMWRYVFAGVLESEGGEAGLELLRALREECVPGAVGQEAMQQSLAEIISEVEHSGFAPKRLHFAIGRFHRWFEINRDASSSAQAQTLAELIETYALHGLQEEYPGTRTRLFLETVFTESPAPLRRALEELARRQHHERLSIDEVLTALSAIQEAHSLDERDAFFFARLSFPHVQPTDSVELQQTLTDGAPMADLVVRFEDQDGIPFSIRRPTSPREISRLHQLFFKERLHVDFRPEHRFLVGVSERGHIIGGLCYLPPVERMAHMEKIVVSDHFRRKGIGEALLNELMSRMRDQGVRHVTTGFFRPEYFYRMGFKVGPRYAGLVKDL
ncbi:MAG: GNAT family N-acetyltransferase, partial [Myxococcota bacterium]